MSPLAMRVSIIALSSGFIFTLLVRSVALLAAAVTGCGVGATAAAAAVTVATGGAKIEDGSGGSEGEFGSEGATAAGAGASAGDSLYPPLYPEGATVGGRAGRSASVQGLLPMYG